MPSPITVASTRYMILSFQVVALNTAEVDRRRQISITRPTMSAIRLYTKATVPGIDEAKFRAVAEDAKTNCPVSKALSAVPITLEAELL